MAYQVDGSKKNPTAGPVKTPAPDVVSTPRNPTGGGGYGENQFNLASSVMPGKSVQSPLAANLRSTVDDPALDQVIAGGSGSRDDVLNTQIRKIGAGNVPPAHGMRNRSGEVGPGDLGNK